MNLYESIKKETCTEELHEGSEERIKYYSDNLQPITKKLFNLALEAEREGIALLYRRLLDAYNMITAMPFNYYITNDNLHENSSQENANAVNTLKALKSDIEKGSKEVNQDLFNDLFADSLIKNAYLDYMDSHPDAEEYNSEFIDYAIKKLS